MLPTDLVGELEALGGEYYRVIVSSREVKTGFWLSRGSIERRDSSEMIGGVSCSASSETEALKRVRIDLKAYLERLRIPPNEWGRVQLRRLLGDYRSFNNEITGLLLKAQELREVGDLTDSNLHEIFWMARERAIAGSLDLAKKIQDLSEEDQVSLVKSSEEVYEDLANPWNLDDADARDALFAFILNPSKAVIAAHEAHLARLRI